ncbi:MAG: hypothetical protein AVDCRST_MAG15-1476, partial [uncultured Rubellimicrobium sp.]
ARIPLLRRAGRGTRGLRLDHRACSGGGSSRRRHARTE